jgi:glycosyltransferase involved in cell wall biosynthesis
MKKLVIDARESGTSTGRYIDKLIENLAMLDTGLKITILTKKHRINYIKQIASNFNVEESGYNEFTFSEQTGFLKQLIDLRADLVHFGMVQQPVLYKGKKVTTMHDLTTARFKNPSKNWFVFTVKQVVYRWLNKKVAHSSEHLITNSEYTKNDIAKFADVNSRKITVTYLAADKIKDKLEPLDELVGSNFIMYVGRPQPHKNLERLIEAFSILKTSHPDLKLVLAGKKDALYKELERKVKEQNVSDVIFPGFISEGQLRWLYENTQSYVFPSLSEGFGLPGLEAMAHGAPVVSSNATCLPEIYAAAASYFNPEDVVEMAQKINEVLSSPQKHKNLSKKGHEQAAKYSWRKMAEQTLNVYRQVLEK